jgi:dihydrofolate synthase/folylpolyglutamate synthase
MTYKEITNFLFAQLPMYQSIGQAAYKADLHNIIVLEKILGNPENKFKSVHVAGTNGKGSVTHILASVFQEAGYKTGIYCSPHLIDFRERIKINGEMISEEEVISFVETYTPLFKNIEPSFFEYTTAMAFHYFAKEKVDIAIVEVGLGGRLDSTNIITPELSVITNIGLDHTDILGDTLEKIAFEKAGIIKSRIPVVIGEKRSETESVFKKIAAEKNAPLFFAESAEMESDLKGFYQKENIATALTSIEKLRAADWKISDKNIADGLLKVVQNTAFIGRWQQLNNHPVIVCDTGHNKEGIERVMAQLKQEKYKNLHIVWGSVNDKDQSKILPLLPKDAIYYLCQPAIGRALPVEELYALAIQFNLNAKMYESPAVALKSARENAAANDFIFVGGSTFVVADVLASNSYR